MCYPKDNATEREKEWGIGADVPYHSPLFYAHGAGGYLLLAQPAPALQVRGKPPPLDHL